MQSWAPVLSLAALIVFQMVSMQGQIGELRADMHREIGSLRTDMHREIGSLRTDMQKEIGDLRNEFRTEIRALGERVARLEALMDRRAGDVAARRGR